MIDIERQTCLLCGKQAITGLHVLGCLLCFSCERRLLHTNAYQLGRGKRWRFLKLYRRAAGEA